MGKFFIVMITLATFLVAEPIQLINGNLPFIEPSKIPSKYIVSFSIFEPYEGKNHKFEGITLKDFTTLYGKKSANIQITAVDYFVSKFNQKEINDPKWIVVFKQDGKFLTPKEKGPARMINKNFKKNDTNSALFDQWVWMIQEIEFK